jgi:hypothetical protein
VEDPEGLYSNLIYGVDFRSVIRMQFQALSKLCTLSQNTLNTSLAIFGQTDFITANVISRAEFDVRTQAIIQQFKKTIPNQFIETLKLIQTTNHGNQLATMFSSNWKFFAKYPIAYIDLLLDQPIHVLTRPQKYGAENCSCGLKSTCSKLSDFPFRTSNQSLRQTLPGFLVGCLLFDSLLQSSLTCLYNETCLGMMRASIYYSKPVPVETLIYSPLMMPNTTIETMLSQLFVSEWFQTISFDLYFNECAPQSCQYSYSIESNIIYVITTLIALFGGLTKGLHFFLYCIQLIVVKFVDCRRKKKQLVPYRNQPDIAVINQDINTIEIDPIEATTTVQVIKLYSCFTNCLFLYCFYFLV